MEDTVVSFGGNYDSLSDRDKEYVQILCWWQSLNSEPVTVEEFENLTYNVRMLRRRDEETDTSRVPWDN